MATTSARTGTVPAQGTELAYLRTGEGKPLVDHYGFLESPGAVLAVVEPFLAAHAS